MGTHRTRSILAVIAAGLLAVSAASTSTAGRKFYDDDPITREPETQDASGVQERDIDLFFDLATNLFARPGDSDVHVRAQNINTIDEVPDSSWFTNRIGAREVSVEEAARGPLSGAGPAAGQLTIIRPKEAGMAPGFIMRDAQGETWFVSFDASGHPEAATGAILVANKIFWTLGYWQVENYLTAIRPDRLVIGESARVRPPSGVRRRMTRGDLEAILRRSHRSADGSYRAVAARAIPGRTLQGFFYYGTRSDDPNDVVPHEHRRELRALKVFGAWTNLVDMKAGNTVDTLITEHGRGVVRHYLQDVGSTFGTGAIGPLDYDEGSEHLYEGDLALKRLVTFGFFVRPWQTVSYPERRAIGRFEADAFDPRAWKPRVPTAAFLRARTDDTFWAARRVMTFSDDMIRAVANTGSYIDPAAARHLADALIKRRNAIGRAYLPAVNPVVDPVLDAGGVLTFRNAAVEAGVATAPAGYRATWFEFDNLTSASRPIGQTTATGPSVSPPPGLPSGFNVFIKVDISAQGGPNPSWEQPVQTYFRRVGAGWRLVGLERLPQQ